MRQQNFPLSLAARLRDEIRDLEEGTSSDARSGALMSIDKLIVRGAREHNLKDVSIELPRESLDCLSLDYQVQVNLVLLSTQSLPKANADMLNLYLPMLANSWDKWINLMLISSRVYLLQYRLIKNLQTEILVLR